MDAFKSAGRAIIKSPGVPRHAWGTSKHEKLPENWTDTKETLLEGMVFNVKYLGMTLVVQPKGEDMASAAIHRIVAMARASAKKFRKVTLTVSPKGIIITDTETADLIENVSIYRISYCTADKTQDKVFAYVSQCSGCYVNSSPGLQSCPRSLGNCSGRQKQEVQELQFLCSQ
ncbi:low density lipoprotein receptor adapter protein 1 isoform X3 [Amphiprion ocellaris]|uniref:low density lipoprotein receptor adapter protein 1 isoform X3 n=1 Tax=Amphiprion ocellaris TaxID=80972 RepID=UPI0024111D30|nr:low density lipoprotein receptor adapter protein 1 isoform X3 [Amphiprion ocellaris]